MKFIISVFLTYILFCTQVSIAQSPLAFNFQGIARDMSGEPLVNTDIGLEFALIQSNPQGPILYLESHNVTTNENALFSVAVGRGFVRFGSIEDIDWSQGPFFMRTALDETGGENFTVVGTSELLSVPFALYAVNSGSSGGKWKESENNIYYTSGDVGIGTTKPNEKLHLRNGNIFIENNANGIIMRSPNGQCWKQSVSNLGETVWTIVSCPDGSTNDFASLSLNPQSLLFEYNDNQESFLLRNNGNVSFEWSVNFPSPYLTVTPSAGNLVPNQTVELNTTVDRSLLTTGLHNYTINLSTDVDIDRNIGVLVNNIPPSSAPKIEVVLPEQPALFAVGEAITFSIDVTDQDTPLSDIEVTMESDIDGVFYTGNPVGNGNLSYTTDMLSRNNHVITISAKDSDNLEDVATIEVSTLAPGEISLEQPAKVNGDVHLRWSEYENSDFLKYDLYRTDGNCTNENGTFLTQINDKSMNTYIDSLAPLNYQVCYYVVVTNDQGLTRRSNEEIVELPSGHIFNFVASDLLPHPTENYVYLIDNGGQRLIKYDYINDDVLAETGLAGIPKFSDIADNGFGVEIAIPINNGKVYIYDGNDLALKQTIITDLVPTCAVQDENGNVVVSVQPSPWWENPIRTYARSNGINLDGGGEQDDERLRKIPGKNEFISISQGSSPTDMNYYKFSDDGLFLEEVDDEYHGTYPLSATIFRISDDGTYVITGAGGTVYSANSSMEYKGELTSASLKYSDFAFSEDGSIIYAATSNRKSIQIGSYPSLIRNDEILTKGYPAFVVRHGDKLIINSKQNEDSVNSGIEVIQL